jgi:hypothetical protein
MFRTALLVLVGLALAAFVAGNWAAFSASTVLTLGVIDVVAPLGLVMLFTLVAVTLVFLIVMAFWQARILGDSRRQTRELAAQRSLADSAEASRLTALRAAMADDIKRLETRLDASDAALRGELRDGFNSVAAMVGEMDDRLAADAPSDAGVATRGPRH